MSLIYRMLFYSHYTRFYGYHFLNVLVIQNKHFCNVNFMRGTFRDVSIYNFDRLIVLFFNSRGGGGEGVVKFFYFVPKAYQV